MRALRVALQRSFPTLIPYHDRYWHLPILTVTGSAIVDCAEPTAHPAPPSGHIRIASEYGHTRCSTK